MLRFIENLLDTYKYVLKFHPVKYLGILVMICGPLYLIYRHIFLMDGLAFMAMGSGGLLLLGGFIWQLGWDPYA
jgi:hypothetical protein